MTVRLHELEAKISKKISHDKSFIEKLKANPNSIIEEEGHISLPKNTVVEVHVAEPDSIYIELPPEKRTLSNQSNDLSKMYQEMYDVEKKESLVAEAVFDYLDYLQRSLAIKAGEDKAFRKKLLNSPTEVVEKILGEKLTKGRKINVFESTMDKLHFTVSYNLSELSDETLEKMSGGIELHNLSPADQAKEKEKLIEKLHYLGKI